MSGEVSDAEARKRLKCISIAFGTVVSGLLFVGLGYGGSDVSQLDVPVDTQTEPASAEHSVSTSTNELTLKP